MSTTATAERRSSSTRLVYLALLAGVLLASLDQSLISTELPTVVGDLGGLRQQVWATTAYLLATTVALPVVGKLGDALGRRALFLISAALFITASLGCAAVDAFTPFAVLRGLQGLGAGGMLVLAQAITAEIAPSRSRGRHLAGIGAMFAIATLAGPLLGGWFVDHASWRWSFLLNVPIGLAVLIAAAALLRPPARQRRHDIDIPGMVCITVAASAVILAADSGGSGSGWTAPATLGLIAVAALACVALLVIEQRATDPLLPVRLLRDRRFLLATLIGAMTGIGMFALIGLLPTYLQLAHGLSATASGLLLVPIMLGLVTTATISGSLISRTGRAPLYLATGAVLAGAALVFLARTVVGGPLLAIEAELLLLGTGIGLIVQNVVTIAQNSQPSADLGATTGLTTTAREIGGAVGASLFGSAYASRIFDGLSQVLRHAPSQGSVRASSFSPELLHRLPIGLQHQVAAVYAHALQPVIWLLVPASAAALLLALLLTSRAPHTATGVASRAS